MLIHVFDVGTLTVVVRGENEGVHRSETDDEIDFALICSEFALATLLDPDAPDVSILEEMDELTIVGDPRTLEKLLAAPSARSALSLRVSLSKGVG